MLNDNEFCEKNLGSVEEDRNRIVSVLRTMLVPAGSDLNEEPFLFMHGNTLDAATLQMICRWARELACDLVYVEFEPGSATLRPRSIHVIVVRDGIHFLTRNCDLWLDPRGAGAVIVRPSAKAGHLVCDGEELVNLPGKPAKSLAPGFRRGLEALVTRAAALPSDEARRFFKPFSREAA